MDKKNILNGKQKNNWTKTITYRFNSTWFWHRIDPILCNNFSCRSKSTEKPILAVTDPMLQEWCPLRLVLLLQRFWIEQYVLCVLLLPLHVFLLPRLLRDLLGRYLGGLDWQKRFLPSLRGILLVQQWLLHVHGCLLPGLLERWLQLRWAFSPTVLSLGQSAVHEFC